MQLGPTTDMTSTKSDRNSRPGTEDRPGAQPGRTKTGNEPQVPQVEQPWTGYTGGKTWELGVKLNWHFHVLEALVSQLTGWQSARELHACRLYVVAAIKKSYALMNSWQDWNAPRSAPLSQQNELTPRQKTRRLDSFKRHLEEFADLLRLCEQHALIDRKFITSYRASPNSEAEIEADERWLSSLEHDGPIPKVALMRNPLLHDINPFLSAAALCKDLALSLENQLAARYKKESPAERQRKAQEVIATSIVKLWKKSPCDQRSEFPGSLTSPPLRIFECMCDCAGAAMPSKPIAYLRKIQLTMDKS